MNSEEFALVFDEQVDRCRSILLGKAAEYATDDNRMHNFNVAANTTGETPIQALGGFMVKHTVSIYDMIRDGEPSSFSDERWDEKITDHINYLILLKALLEDSKKNRVTVAVNGPYWLGTDK